MLDDLDWELDRRGLRFVRYADDGRIYVRSRRAGERVMESITRYIEQRLKLRVNREKSVVDRATRRPLLGFGFFARGGEVKVRIDPKARARAKDRLPQLTARTWGVPMERRIHAINRFTVGWTAYFALADTPSVLEELDEWLRRRLRQVRWKEWKRSSARRRNLIALGAPPDKAREWAATRKGPWRTAGSAALQRTLTNGHWTSHGLRGFTDPYRRLRDATRTARCGPARRVVWEGRGEPGPYPILGDGGDPEICPQYVPRSAYDLPALNPPRGHVFQVGRARGPAWYMKYRLPDGRQVQKKHGPAHRTRPQPQAVDAPRLPLGDRGERRRLVFLFGPLDSVAQSTLLCATERSTSQSSIEMKELDMNGTLDNEQNTADDERSLDPREAAALINQTEKQAQRQFNLSPPWVTAVMGAVILVAYGALWLSTRGQHPYKGPSAGAIVLTYVAVAVTLAVGAKVYQRATAGVSGPSVRQQKIMGIAVAISFLGSPLIQGAMKHYGASDAIVYGVIPAAAPLIIVGTTVVGVAGTREDWPQFGAALAVVAAGVVALFVGPSGAWLAAGIGVFIAVVGYAIATGRRLFALS